MSNHLILSLIFILSACTQQESSSNGVNNSNASSVEVQENSMVTKMNDKVTSKVQNEVFFHVNLISAFEFLKRSNKEISEKDREDLNDEYVLILDAFTVNKGLKNLIKEKSSLGSSDESIQYMMSQFSKDVIVNQGDKKYFASGLELDQGINVNNKFRVYLFFKGIDQSKKIEITYYDMLFGTGIQKFSIDKIRKHDS